jgi:hypothetical protein
MLRNPLKKDKNGGRPDLTTAKAVERSKEEFAPNGTGGHEEDVCEHGISLMKYCGECEAIDRVKKVVNMEALADKIETNPLDKIADIVHGLTYQQMVQFCCEYENAARFDTFDIDMAKDDIRELAAKMHKWCVLRAKP